MNDKLTRWRPNQRGIGPQNLSRHGKGQDDRLVTLSVRRDKKSAAYDLVCISLHPRAVQQAGWQPNDIILFEYDRGNVFLFKDATGRKLGQTKECSRSRARFRIRPEYASMLRDMEASEIEIDQGRIAFELRPI